MLTFPDFKGMGSCMVTSLDELPTLSDLRSSAMILDFETTSGDKSLDALAPFEHCDVAGIAIKGLSRDRAYYIPIGHRNQFAGYNLPRQPVIDWLRGVFKEFEGLPWINANVKYDVQVAYAALGLEYRGPLHCITVQAKLIDSDRMYRGGYGLDALMRIDLGIDIYRYEAAIKQYLVKNKDYGLVDPVPMAEYACVDVHSVDLLYPLQLSQLPEECNYVVNNERRLTPVLARMERVGMKHCKEALAAEMVNTMSQMMSCQGGIYQQSGRFINPGSSPQVHDLLCNYYGLPVLKYTTDEDGEETENPSFNKQAMLEYLGLADCPIEVVEAIRDYRTESKFKSAFLEVFHDAADADDVLHGTYNQCVRTGRLSCARPNNMQFNKRAKKLIIPRKGNAFLSIDQSQIEFRLIAHYIRDSRAISAYAADPDTDFHAWVAMVCSCSRDPAKMLNFLSAYGGGKLRMKLALSSIKEVRATVMSQCESHPNWGRMEQEQRSAYFSKMLEASAGGMHETYHKELPNLKRVAKRAQNICWQRGYVINLFGRRRHLPRSVADKPYSPTKDAFNSLCQSSAADLVKASMVEMSEYLHESWGVEMIAQVHDELLFEGPKEIIMDPRFKRDVAAIMETPPPYLREPLQVPLRVSGGVSDESWAAAGAKGNTSVVPLDEIRKAEKFSWVNKM